MRVDVQYHSFLNSLSDGVDGQRHTPATSAGNSLDTQCAGGGIGSRECLGGCGEEETSLPLPVFETSTFQHVASRSAITSFICCFSFVERSEQCPVAFMSKGEYVSGLTRFNRTCRGKADIKH